MLIPYCEHIYSITFLTFGAMAKQSFFYGMHKSFNNRVPPDIKSILLFTAGLYFKQKHKGGDILFEKTDESVLYEHSPVGAFSQYSSRKER